VFRIEHKDHTRRWKRLGWPHPDRFPTEQAAWDHVASLDQDGLIDRFSYRVKPA